MSVEYWTRCKYCKAKILFMKCRDKTIPVDHDSLTVEERRSLIMNIPVPFDPIQHRKHFETCTKRINQHKDVL